MMMKTEEENRRLRIVSFSSFSFAQLSFTHRRLATIQRDIKSRVLMVFELNPPSPKPRFLSKTWVAMEIVRGLIHLRVNQVELFFAADTV